MPQQFDMFEEDSGSGLLADLLRNSDRLFVKKLSNNDRDWARMVNKHQAGVYVPPRERDSGFFPLLVPKDRDDPEAHEIRETWYLSFFGLGQRI